MQRTPAGPISAWRGYAGGDTLTKMLGVFAALLVAVLGPAPAPADVPPPSSDRIVDPFAPRDAAANDVATPRPAAPEASVAPMAVPGETVPGPTRTASRAPLRDPFAAAASPSPTRARISSDLKDPFAPRRGGASVPSTPIRDLRDPFVPRPGGCSTHGGVPLQRPKSLRAQPSRCAGSDAPLLDPFRTA